MVHSTTQPLIYSKQHFSSGQHLSPQNPPAQFSENSPTKTSHSEVDVTGVLYNGRRVVLLLCSGPIT